MALGHDVAHTQHLEHGTHRTAGNHAGTVSSRGDVHARSAVTAFNDVRNRAAAQGHLEHLAACFVHGFLHRHGHLAGLALAHADATITVTNHDQGCKTQNPTTFNNLGDPVDADHLFLQTVITLIGPALRATCLNLCHSFSVLRTSVRPRVRLQPARGPVRDSDSRSDRTQPIRYQLSVPSLPRACRRSTLH